MKNFILFALFLAGMLILAGAAGGLEQGTFTTLETLKRCVIGVLMILPYAIKNRG